MIDNGEIGRIIEKGVNGEITAKRIFFGGAKEVVADDEPVVDSHSFALLCFFGGGGNRCAESGGFNGFVFEENMGKAKPTTDDAAISEKASNLFGSCFGGNIEVFGLAIEH